MDVNELKKMIEENEVKAIDLKYCGLEGRWYHITFPARRLDYVLENGVSFDGSSIPGMKAVESGDMIIRPDISTATLDKFTETPIIRMLCSICDAQTGIGVKKDPRSLALRAQSYMESTGIADQSMWIPELEFYLFDEAEYYNSKYSSGYHFSSSQNKDCLPDDEHDGEAISQQDRKGYHMDTPFDRYFELRQDVVDYLEEEKIDVRYHHHEVGLAGQQEIETEPSEFPRICDSVMIMKDTIRKVSHEYGLTATFMPKPVYNEPGNGMHFHILLRKEGKNIFFEKGRYADLSHEALFFIGGILQHGPSLTAFTNPSTNSFKRLLPGFEAPVKLFYGLANRSAAIRIPNYVHTEAGKRIEFRTGDATANPYLAMSAILMAGLDGIKNRIHPNELGYGPYDDNVFNWPKAMQDQLRSIPTNLEDALLALKADHEYLLAGDVFNKELIDAWIDIKMKEVHAVGHRPHPYEMNLYYNL